MPVPDPTLSETGGSDPTLVGSAADPRLDPFRNLKGRANRADNTFVAESELVLDRLLDSGITVHSILVTPARAQRVADVIAAKLDLLRRGGVEVFVASQSIVDSVVGYPLHRGVVAVADRPALPSIDEALQAAQTVVVLEEVMDPDNVGAIFRHSAGFGVDAIILHGRTGDPLYRKTIRTSMGWSIELPYAHIAASESAAGLLRSKGFATLALTPDRSAESIANVVESTDQSTRIALFLGAEGPGLKASTMSQCDHRVRIPLSNGVDSLNVATAAAIALYALVERQPSRLRQGRGLARGADPQPPTRTSLIVRLDDSCAG